MSLLIVFDQGDHPMVSMNGKIISGVAEVAIAKGKCRLLDAHGCDLLEVLGKQVGASPVAGMKTADDIREYFRREADEE